MDRKRELELFFGEVEERLGILEENFLQLEQEGARPDLIQRLFSAAHNIKGVSGIVGFSELGKLAHSMEDVLSEVRKGALPITPPLVDALLSAKDSLKNLVSAFAQGAPIPEFQSSVDQLNQLLGKQGQAGPARTREDLMKELSVKVEPEEGDGTLRMAISLDPESPLLEIRLMQIQEALGSVGTLLATVPEELGGGNEVCLALRTDAPLVHEDLFTVDFAGQSATVPSNVAHHVEVGRGNLERGFAEADVVIERTFRGGTLHQGYLEPQACTVLFDASGHLTDYTSTQAPFELRDTLAAVLVLPKNRVTVVPLEIGGGF
ncbi:MAG: molybdopterin-dependent oxidoreductase, partial [Armatimonadetes bacterium]|nr:molybdopterin-dependent oxidoreductase [Armatimonadota bacterium]